MKNPNETLESLLKIINDSILPLGGSLYFLISHNLSSCGDESKLETWTFERNTHDTEEQIDKMDSEIWTKLLLLSETQNSFILEWTTDKLDWIRIQSTDHYLHIIEMNSGQY